MGPQGPGSENELGVGSARLPPGSQVQSGARPLLALSSLRPPADLPASEVDGPREHLQQPLHHPERRVVLRDPALGDLHAGYTSFFLQPAASRHSVRPDRSHLHPGGAVGRALGQGSEALLLSCFCVTLASLLPSLDLFTSPSQ